MLGMALLWELCPVEMPRGKTESWCIERVALVVNTRGQVAEQECGNEER